MIFLGRGDLFHLKADFLLHLFPCLTHGSVLQLESSPSFSGRILIFMSVASCLPIPRLTLEFYSLYLSSSSMSTKQFKISFSTTPGRKLVGVRKSMCLPDVEDTGFPETPWVNSSYSVWVSLCSLNLPWAFWCFNFISDISLRVCSFAGRFEKSTNQPPTAQKPKALTPLTCVSPQLF